MERQVIQFYKITDVFTDVPNLMLCPITAMIIKANKHFPQDVNTSLKSNLIDITILFQSVNFCH